MEQRFLDQFFRRAMLANWGLGALLRFTNGPLLQLVGLQVFRVDLEFFLVLTIALGLTNLAQLYGLACLYRYGPFCPLLRSYYGRSFALIVMAVLPMAFAPTEMVAAYIWAILIVALNLFHATGFAVCWPPIVRAGTDKISRGRVTSRLRATQTFTVAALVTTIALLGPENFTSTAFSVLCTLFFLFSIVSTVQVRWMAANVPTENRKESESFFALLRQDIRVLTSDKRAKELLILVVAFGTVGLPLQVFYLDSVLKLSREIIFWFVALNTLIGIFSMLAWGGLIDKRGGNLAGRAALFCVATGLILQVSWLIFFGSNNEAPITIFLALFSIILVNIGTQALGIIWFNSALDILPAKHTAGGVMILGCIYESTLVVSSVLAGVVWNASAIDVPLILEVPHTGYIAFLLVILFVTFCCLGYLRKRRAELCLEAT
jgi:hypothetical protein